MDDSKPTKNLRYYVASFVGILEIKDPVTGTQHFAVQHHPKLFPCPDIETAAKMARSELESKWDKSKGWDNRSAAIHPLDSEQMKMLRAIIRVGIPFIDAKDVAEQSIVINIDRDAANGDDGILIDADTAVN